MASTEKSTSSKVKSAIQPALRRARRIGWAAEDRLDVGAKIVRTHPGKFATVVVGAVALLALVALACRKTK